MNTKGQGQDSKVKIQKYLNRQHRGLDVVCLTIEELTDLSKNASKEGQRCASEEHENASARMPCI